MRRPAFRYLFLVLCLLGQSLGGAWAATGMAGMGLEMAAQAASADPAMDDMAGMPCHGHMASNSTAPCCKYGSLCSQLCLAAATAAQISVMPRISLPPRERLHYVLPVLAARSAHQFTPLRPPALA